VIALDTNVLVRILVVDDQRQSARAAALVRRAGEAGERLFVSDVVLCETMWVLTSSYRTPRDEVAGVLTRLLRSRELEFEDSDLLARALRAYEGGRGDLADYVIRERARRSGCSSVLTFDKVLLKEEGFESA
jgi:predicted nucleic-acid-binding protein